jgi:hypothetical protein
MPDWGSMINSFVSVEIDDLHVVDVTVNPVQTDTSLIIDPDAVLAFAVALQRIESIGR